MWQGWWGQAVIKAPSLPPPPNPPPSRAVDSQDPPVSRASGPGQSPHLTLALPQDPFFCAAHPQGPPGPCALMGCPAESWELSLKAPGRGRGAFPSLLTWSHLAQAWLAAGAQRRKESVRVAEETRGCQTAEARLGDLMHFRGLEWHVEGQWM